MKASAQIRKFASGIAATHPTLAYDLLDLSTKVAEDEQQSQQEEPKSAGEVPPQFLEHMKEKKEDSKDDEKKDDAEGQAKQAYLTLKSACIQMAAANPALRDAYLPILKTIKQLG